MTPLLIALLFACQSPSPDTRLRAAEDAMDRLEHRLALDELAYVMSAPDATDDQLVRAHLLAGIAQRLAGSDTEARMHFLTALRMHPDATLPARSESASPRVKQFFEDVRREAAGPPPAPLPPAAPADPAAQAQDGGAAAAAAPARGFPWLLVGGATTVGVSAVVAVALWSGTVYASSVVTDVGGDTETRQTAQSLGQLALLGAGIGVLGVFAGAGLVATALVVGE